MTQSAWCSQGRESAAEARPVYGGMHEEDGCKPREGFTRTPYGCYETARGAVTETMAYGGKTRT